MSVFLNVNPATKTKEAKKITRLANKIPTVRRDVRKPGAVVVIYSKAV